MTPDVARRTALSTAHQDNALIVETILTASTMQDSRSHSCGEQRPADYLKCEGIFLG